MSAAGGLLARRLAVGVALLAILALAAWLRLAAVAGTEVERPIRNDAKDYVAYAYNTKVHGEYSSTVAWLDEGPPVEIVPDARRPPGYPLFLMPFLDGAPDDGFVQRAETAQAWLGTLLVLLAFALTARLLSPRAGLGVALLVALSPHLVVFVTYLLTETLYAAAIALAALAGAAWAFAQGRRRWLWAFLGGAALGLCSLVRPTLDQLPWVLLLMVLVLPPLRAHRLSAALALAGFLAVMSPWLVRNATTLGKPSDSRLMISTLHHGSYPGFMYNDDPATRGYPYAADPRTPEVEASLSAVLHEIARKFAAEPLRYAGWYLFGKPAQFLAWEIVDGWGDIYTYPELKSPYLSDKRFIATRSLMLGLHTPLAIAGVAGLLLVLGPWARRFWDGARLTGLRVCGLLFLYAIGLHMVGAPFPRYSVPFRPLQYLMAAALICALAAVVRQARAKA